MLRVTCFTTASPSGWSGCGKPGLKSGGHTALLRRSLDGGAVGHLGAGLDLRFPLCRAVLGRLKGLFRHLARLRELSVAGDFIVAIYNCKSRIIIA